MPAARLLSALALAAALAAVPAACSSGTGPESDARGAGQRSDAAPGPGAPCPVARIPVAVSVDQWRDVVAHSGGDCVAVTTVVDRTGVDPHEYEPTPADQAALVGARLVVMNGLGYDSWVTRALDTAPERPALVEAAAVPGAAPPDGNPHVWNRPAAVDAVSRAVTAELRRLLPDAGAYLDEQASAWAAELAPYRAAVADIAARHASRPYGATEPVFDPMAQALGLRDGTPEGFRSATANEGEPSPGDLAAFRTVLRDRAVDVLVYNTQTEGSVPEQLRAAAGAAGIAVVEVTETVPPGQPSFVAWQLDQLRRLDEALVGSR